MLNAKHLKNINELGTICKEEWSQTPSDICLDLVKDHNKRLADVIKLKGYTIEYVSYKNMFDMNTFWLFC